MSAQPPWPRTIGGPTSTQQLLLQSLLADRLATNPALQQMLPLLGMTPSGGAPGNGVPDGRPTAGSLVHGAQPDLTAERSAAHRALANVQAELRRTHELLDRVAQAVGACANCLGSEPACPYCTGTGGPGSRPLDEGLLPWLIQPLLDQLDDTGSESRTNGDEPRTADRPTGR
jgi:hypothetical protein